ncbi:hypothetical protein SteCoe_37103 [Stentor coeruleus]|uniref:Uncharacterized protein n=1 Tax=Stentor coeruleus TaxID=5963 RepID=A0A1R2ANY5_9CILI|nr:hypothetical protein SteCoe_37103 [Stentor coeruleus]
MNESFCCICFCRPIRYIRACMCSYCESCRSTISDSCQCGRGGGIVDIQTTQGEIFKFIKVSEITSLKKIEEIILDYCDQQIKGIFDLLIYYYELREVYMQKIRAKKICEIEKLQKENIELKKQLSQIQGQGKVMSFDQDFFSKDTYVEKKQFDFSESFNSLFKKK